MQKVTLVVNLLNVNLEAGYTISFLLRVPGTLEKALELTARSCDNEIKNFGGLAKNSCATQVFTGEIEAQTGVTLSGFA